MSVWMCVWEKGGEGSLQHRARFLCGSTLSAEDDDSSIVSLQARFSDLLFRLCEVADSTLQLWLRAFMSSAIAWVRSSDVGERAGNCWLGSRTWSRVRWMRC